MAHWARWRFAVAAAAGAAVLPLTGATASPAPADLSAAKARAATLNATVERLQLRAEMSAEAYNAAIEEAAQLRAGTTVSAAKHSDQQSEADRVLARNADRVRLLYQSQGEYGLLDLLFVGGTPEDLLDRARVASTVVAGNRADAAAALAGTRESGDIAAAAADTARRQGQLAAAAGRHAGEVRQALTAAGAALAGADAEVRRVAEAERKAAEVAAARAFAARLAAARQAAARVAAARQAAAEQAAQLGNRAFGAGGPLAATSGPGGGATVGLAAPGPAAAAALAAAQSRLGLPYVWGAVGPATFDCSGLTGWAYRQAGVSLPRTAAEQWNSGPHPALAELAPGDLLFWATNPADPSTIHHVALYLGNGQMIAAPHSGDVVRVQAVYATGFIGAVRPTAG